jgi:hypothetical protein
LRWFFAQGKYYAQVLCAGIGSATLLICMPFFVIRSGVSGAVAATGAGMLLWSLSMMGLMVRTGELNIRQVVAKPLAAACASVGVYICLSGVGPLVALPTSLAILSVFIFLLDLFTPYERSVLLRAVKSIAFRK